MRNRASSSRAWLVAMFVQDQRKSKRPAADKRFECVAFVRYFPRHYETWSRNGVREERRGANRSRDRQRSIASVLTSACDLLSRTAETDDISRRIIFLSLSIARTASIFLFRLVQCPDVRAGRGNTMRFHPDVFAVRSANGFRDTIEDSAAGVVVSLLPVQWLLLLAHARRVQCASARAHALPS